MEFETCEISGQLKAEGERGQYFVNEQAFTYVKIVTVDAEGPNIESIGCFTTVEDAIEYINVYDKGEGDE